MIHYGNPQCISKEGWPNVLNSANVSFEGYDHFFFAATDHKLSNCQIEGAANLPIWTSWNINMANQHLQTPPLADVHLPAVFFWCSPGGLEPSHQKNNTTSPDLGKCSKNKWWLHQGKHPIPYERKKSIDKRNHILIWFPNHTYTHTHIWCVYRQYIHSIYTYMHGCTNHDDWTPTNLV